MGKFEKGILGHVDGKVGTIVGATWRGVNYMRSKARKSKKPATEKQLEQQAKFSLVTKFIQPMTKLLAVSFNDPKINKSGVNRALAYNILHAVIGTYPNFSIDYKNALVSQGTLHNVFMPAATATANGIVKFNWTANTGALSNDDDACIAVIYCPEMKLAVYSMQGTSRQSGEHELNALIFTGKTVETWIFFVSASGEETSPSIYAGQVVVA